MTIRMGCSPRPRIGGVATRCSKRLIGTVVTKVDGADTSVFREGRAVQVCEATGRLFHDACGDRLPKRRVLKDGWYRTLAIASEVCS